MIHVKGVVVGTSRTNEESGLTKLINQTSGMTEYNGPANQFPSIHFFDLLDEDGVAKAKNHEYERNRMD